MHSRGFIKMATATSRDDMCYRPQPQGAYASDGVGLEALARSFLGRLPQSTRKLLVDYAGALRNDFSTVCSGTDSPVLCIAAFQAACRHLLGCAPLATHRFSCEKSVEKQAFLKAMYDLNALFDDVQCLTQAAATDRVSDTDMPIPRCKGTIGGFPCTDVANLNIHASQNKECVASGSLRTGGVFQKIIEYLQHHDLDWAVLENVLGLRRTNSSGCSNLQSCRESLRAAGYFVQVLELDSLMFGQLHSRGRLYLVCIKLKLLEDVNVDENLAGNMLRKTMDRLVGMSSVDIDDVILPEAHPLVQRYMRQLMEEPAAHSSSSRSDEHVGKRLKGSSWAAAHAAKFASAGLDWTQATPFKDPDLRQLFPGVRALTDRQIDVLQASGVSLPDAQRRVVDVSMSIDWASSTVGRAGCFSSGSQLWLGHRGRLSLGVEALRMMNIRFSNEKLLESFPDALLRDLAGNAFDGSSFMAVWVALSCMLAFLDSRR